MKQQAPLGTMASSAIVMLLCIAAEARRTPAASSLQAKLLGTSNGNLELNPEQAFELIKAQEEESLAKAPQTTTTSSSFVSSSKTSTRNRNSAAFETLAAGKSRTVERDTITITTSSESQPFKTSGSDDSKPSTKDSSKASADNKVEVSAAEGKVRPRLPLEPPTRTTTTTKAPAKQGAPLTKAAKKDKSAKDKSTSGSSRGSAKSSTKDKAVTKDQQPKQEVAASSTSTTTTTTSGRLPRAPAMEPPTRANATNATTRPPAAVAESPDCSSNSSAARASNCTTGADSDAAAGSEVTADEGKVDSNEKADSGSVAEGDAIGKAQQEVGNDDAADSDASTKETVGADKPQRAPSAVQREAPADTDTEPAAALPPPKLSIERVVFQLEQGDVEFGFYPDVAPKTSEHVFTMATMGMYISDCIFRVDKGYLAQVSTIGKGRTTALNEQQKELASRTVPLEVSPAALHVEGALSMARFANSASSFSFLYGAAPHLDGKYTVFGRVTKGMDVLHALEKVPTRSDGTYATPLKRVSILGTYWYRSMAGPPHLSLYAASDNAEREYSRLQALFLEQKEELLRLRSLLVAQDDEAMKMRQRCLMPAPGWSFGTA